MKQFFKSKEKLWVPLIIVDFAVLLVTPQLFTRKVILGSDSVFTIIGFMKPLCN